MRSSLRTRLLIAALAALPVTALPVTALPVTAKAAEPPRQATDTLLVQHPEIVVSATRTVRDQVNVPNGTSVITGAELRRRGTRTVAEALQDIVGLDTGEGSDNGSRLPNVGMWGLKEFDALLFTLNGVPVGGPFNPSLSQIPVEDVDRVEIAKGPQGTMYGVSAFAGMIQVFTPHTQSGGMVTAGGGSFSSGQGSFGWGKPLSGDKDFRINGSFGRSDGWQDRNESKIGRGGASLGMPLGSGRLRLDVSGFQDHQDWGSPLPYDAGALQPGFVIDRNYAFKGAEVQHQVFSGTALLTWPTGASHRFENTLGFTRDAQNYVRSFTGETDSTGALQSEGLALDPKEISLYEDARWLANFEGKGTHEVVVGTALTLGKTNGTAHEYRFGQFLSDYSSIPSVDTMTANDNRDFEDMRVFVGVYAHDAWTPVPRFTLEGGARFDFVSEELETEADLPGGPVKVKDNREDSDFSGDISALIRIVPEAGKGGLDVANLYGSVRRGFKPAAPNLAEAEAAQILEPENTTSWEVGLKTRGFQGLAFDVSYFDMKFENMVVSVLDAGLPKLTNAGEQRFKGVETDLRWSPASIPGFSLGVGYAHHDARFVDFTFVTPDGQFRDVSGKQLELVPRELVSGRVSYVHATGLGGFAALRYQGERPFNRRNTFFADAYTEYDAGVSYDHSRWRFAVVGRNLGDDRHVVTESEIGDAQFYVAPPRRVSAEVGYRF